MSGRPNETEHTDNEAHQPQRPIRYSQSHFRNAFQDLGRLIVHPRAKMLLLMHDSLSKFFADMFYGIQDARMQMDFASILAHVSLDEFAHEGVWTPVQIMFHRTFCARVFTRFPNLDQIAVLCSILSSEERDKIQCNEDVEANDKLRVVISDVDKMPQTCACCSRVQYGRSVMYICTSCHLAFYCNQACQKQHWKQHRPTCHMFRDVLRSEKESHST